MDEKFCRKYKQYRQISNSNNNDVPKIYQLFLIIFLKIVKNVCYLDSYDLEIKIYSYGMELQIINIIGMSMKSRYFLFIIFS